MVQVQAGHVTLAQIGGTGRILTGRLVASDPQRRIDWQHGHRTLGTKQPKPPRQFESQAEYEEWNNSDEVRRARESYRYYTVIMEPDGRFRIEDVPAGEYSLSIHVTEPPETPHGMGKQLGSIQQEVIVPEMPGGRSDEPMDLGELKVVLKKDLRIGMPAPDFEVKTLDGKTLKLSDLRGKYVLLDFWATWCGPCVAEMPHLKEVYEAFGKNEKFVMMGLSLDDNEDAPRKFAARHEIAWTQGFLGEWSKTQLPNEYGVSGIPSLFLVDPQGNIAAKDIRGSGIKSAVSSALGR